MKRLCPKCKELSIDVEELNKSEQVLCVYCNSTVTNWFSSSIFLSVITGGGAFLSFKNDLPIMGFTLFVLSVIYCVFYKKINSHLLPLRVYNR
ncbi:MAG: hypothetical protein ACJASI_001827 [Glaciecola sp.]|jgi:hypothetical protein